MANETKKSSGLIVTDFSSVQLPDPREKSQGPFGKKDEDKTPVEFWLNVGVRRLGKLVSLPGGIPLDKLKARAIPRDPENKNPEFKQLRQAEAMLWEELRSEVMAKLNPGERVVLPFEVEVYRVLPEEQVPERADESNPFVSSGGFFAKPNPA